MVINLNFFGSINVEILEKALSQDLLRVWMRKLHLLLTLLVITLPTQQVWMCPPTGSHIGVIINEALPLGEVLERLQLIGVSVKHEVVQHRLISGEYASFETVVFDLGFWLPSDPITGQALRADARLYIGNGSMALKVNTTLLGSPEPLKRALALLYNAEVISYLPKQRDFMKTEGNRVPADVVVAWAKQELGLELEQLVLKCHPSGTDLMVPSLMTSDEVVVLANGVDAGISYPILRETLVSKGLNPSLIGPDEFRQHLNAWILIVLGGPEAYEGVGNISDFLLQPSDSEYLRKERGSYLVYSAQPLFGGQKIFVLAGNDRYGTKKAVEVFIEEFLDKLLEQGPSPRYEFETTHMTFAREPVIKGYPCMLFVEVFSTLRTPCYKPVVNFQLEGNKIEIKVEFVQLPIICIQAITTGDLRVYVENLPPGDYEVTIISPEGKITESISIPPCRS
ncbi:MAG: hypothetical protein DRO00_07135 [Thermoproteota archaeon]|nr:MAG: hypothetical protein DRO00_07135 [Candidatus Korarchaeota archaeon]